MSKLYQTFGLEVDNGSSKRFGLLNQLNNYIRLQIYSTWVSDQENSRQLYSVAVGKLHKCKKQTQILKKHVIEKHAQGPIETSESRMPKRKIRIMLEVLSRDPPHKNA